MVAEAEMRVRQIEPHWRPKPTLSDPNDIESRIARNEDMRRQADARYADYLFLEKYPDLIRPRDRSPGTLTGPLARVLERDDAETQRGKTHENEAADIYFLHGHNVVRRSQSTSAQGVKQPDYVIDGEVFDNFTPRTGRARNIWTTAETKIIQGQTENLSVYLRDTPVAIEELMAQFTHLSDSWPEKALGDRPQR